MIETAHDSFRVLARLKDFQRRTVDYVFRRLYTDVNPGSRFLVADEVGLGKTMVARGIIARVIEHLHAKDDRRIDIVYICSNSSIASQNIRRLNVTGVQEFVHATRLSLLPMHIEGIRGRKVNYVSLTPGTSFDPKSREGKDEERALIHHILKGRLDVSPAGLRRLLQGRVSDDSWEWWTREWKPESLDKDIAEAFAQSVSSDTALHNRMTEFCGRSTRRVLREDSERLKLVFELRMRLAEMSLEALEPDLIILDEFQRFKNLLDPDNPEARLAQKLFRNTEAKTLLLSATPYKMLSLDHEQEDDHYPDFLKTLEFLFGSKGPVEEVKREIQAYRRSLYILGSGSGDAISGARDALQSSLRSVMCRTERVDMTRGLDSMLTEKSPRTALLPRDLHDAALADRIASSVGARDIIEYWKSSPYLINFLRRYEFRRKLEKQCEEAPDALLAALEEGDKRLLRKSDIENYREISPANAKMRYLLSQTMDRGLWKLPWLPPSMPYSRPEGHYAGLTETTKYLVFSAWNVVPDAIASLCSYEAERRMLAALPKFVRHDELYDELRPLLKFTRGTDGRFSGMSAFTLLYPSPGLASLVDPLRIALDFGETELMPSDELIRHAGRILKPHLLNTLDGAPEEGPEDQRWYWVAPAVLDARLFPGVKTWLFDEKEGWLSISVVGHEDRGEGFKEHLGQFQRAMAGTLDPPLGKPPGDLIQILARSALAGPGVCGLRALHRMSPSMPWDSPSLLRGAVRIAEGFRTLYNIPETIALLRGAGPDTFYWKHCLRQGLEGNLQSVLDEQAHCLLESLGVADSSASSRAEAIGEAIGASLTIRTSQLQLDEVRVRPRLRKVEFEGYKTRCRFALRFGEIQDEDGQVARADIVRDAFNSPFRPFVLASTSIGQEGLDFHTWCHSIVHWNLPSNPVDLEQREGRIHRYKGHAVRKNIAKVYGLRALKAHDGKWDVDGDPWHFLFEQARNERFTGASDLVPYWLFEVEGGARIERHVPMLALSKDELYFQRLKRMLAVYRLVFGQPRQEELLEYLANSDGNLADSLNRNAWRISLIPP